MRGEYGGTGGSGVQGGELPPRARRIQRAILDALTGVGTTSACAENTVGHGAGLFARWNYLRVRGEYRSRSTCSAKSSELPPRARRIPGQASAPLITGGTTSACAENTMVKTTKPALRWNYLRVRGEYTPLTWTNSNVRELPPRARRIRHQHASRGRNPGTTSACAENTGSVAKPAFLSRNYLRVRGEYPK